MDNELSYYEVEMGYLKDGADDIEYESPFTLCISTLYFPDTESIIALCNKELDKDYDYVHSITRISADEQAEMFSDITYKLMSEDECCVYKDHIKRLLNLLIPDEFVDNVLNTVDHETDKSFADAIIENVKDTSSWREGVKCLPYIELADLIGREIIARMGLEF